MKNSDFVGTESTIIFFLEKTIGILMGWLLHMFLSRALGPNGYGQFSLIYVVFIIFTSLFTPGISLAVTRFAAMTLNPRGVLLSGVRIEIVFDIFIYIVYFSLLNTVCRILAATELYPYIALMGLMIMPQGLASVALGYLRGCLKFNKWFRVNVIRHIVRISSCVLLVMLGFGLLGVIIALMITELVFFVSSILSVRIEHTESTTSFKEILQMSLPFWIVGLSALIMQRTDIVCIKYFLKDYRQVGYYASAAKLAETLSIFTCGFSFYLLPVLSAALKSKQKVRIQEILERTARYCFIVSAPLCIWSALHSKTIMSVIFSYRFSMGASVLSLLSISWIALSILVTINMIILAKGKLWAFFIIGLFYTCLNIFLNFVLIPIWGINGAAMATAVSLLLVQITLFIYAYKSNILPIRKILWVSKKTMLRVFVAIMAIVMFSRIMPIFSQWFIFGAETIFAMMLYLGLLFVLKEFTQEDRNIINFIRKKF